MRARQFLFEYDNVDQLKAEILKTINSIDTAAGDEKMQKQNAELLDRVYTILNKSNVVDRFQSVLPSVLRGEYNDQEIMKIAGKISEAPISYKDKVRFVSNLEKDTVINPKVLITPGQYTIDELCNNDPVNKAMFDHLKIYGVGQKMKGPAEHALAILSQKISIEGKGDVTIGNVAVEVKAAVGEKLGSGGGRFGETGRLPSRQTMVDILQSFEVLAPTVNQFLERQASMNVETFVKLVDQVNPDPNTRKAIGQKVFGTIFGNEAAPVVDTFARGASPDEVRRAYIESNFNWYKNSDMGGDWSVLCSISFANNSVATITSGDDLRNITMYKKNPAIITTDKPQEMLFQFNPKNA